MEVAPVHQVENEAEFVRGVEGVGHADNEGTVMASAHQAQHYPLVQGQSLSLLHLNALLIKTLKQSKSVLFILQLPALPAHLHCVHLARVRLPAPVHLSEPAPPDNSVDREVVHAEVYIEFQILPLTEPGGVIYFNLNSISKLK